jgi:hypothetical protein
MAISLIVDTDTPPMPWNDFKKSSYSIALDGFVYGGPQFDPTSPAANFNHHEEVDRLATRATCAQVLLAVRQGLLDSFRSSNGDIQAKVFVNDCDQDVCLSWFILKNSWLCENIVNPNLNRLVHIEDMMDTCAGAYPFSMDMPILQEVAWVFEPYTKFRIGGGLDRKNQAEYVSVINDVCNRIMRHITGTGERLTLDTRHEIIGGNGKWHLVKEIGADARSGLLSSGVKAFVSVRQRPSGNWTYSIGKISPFIPFDVKKILDALNIAEGSADDKWGGALTIGGSPRVNGSKLTPEQVEKIVNDTNY